MADYRQCARTARRDKQTAEPPRPPPHGIPPPLSLCFLSGMQAPAENKVKQGVSKCSWGAGLFVCHHADDHRVLSAFPKPQTLCNSLETHAPKGKSMFEKKKAALISAAFCYE